MPHYKDGSVARVGDFVKGYGYNEKDKSGQPRLLVGTVTSINETAETCNCAVAFLDVVPEAKVPTNGRVTRLGNGMFLIEKMDYGETRQFEKINPE